MTFLITPNGRREVLSEGKKEDSSSPYHREFADPASSRKVPILFHNDRASVEHDFATEVRTLANQYQIAGLHDNAKHFHAIADEHERHSNHHAKQRDKLRKQKNQAGK